MTVKRIARSVGAVLGGYAVMAIIVILGTMGAMAMFGLSSSDAPTPWYLVVNLGISALAAFVGGFACARLSPTRPLVHAAVIAVVVAAASLGGRSTGGQPVWYGGAIAALGVAGVLAGATVAAARLKRDAA